MYILGSGSFISKIPSIEASRFQLTFFFFLNFLMALRRTSNPAVLTARIPNNIATVVAAAVVEVVLSLADWGFLLAASSLGCMVPREGLPAT